uniref:Dynein light chain n=1 Tax=Albugo laibachii Nc14 TaxID=890382 RepID=F0WDU3_9STRA|nr:dynein light chain putative [Albugo laibachii Nc14]|eukprot:CCA19370.1 dynein light chain putative [Albugo laibachii Nc14]
MASVDAPTSNALPLTDDVSGLQVSTVKISILRLELTTAMKDDAISQFCNFLRAAPVLIEKDLASELKKYFDKTYGHTWQCIVGKGFGCSIAYDTQYLLFFKANQHNVLLFKSVE